MTPPTFLSADYNLERVFVTWMPPSDTIQIRGYRISIVGPSTSYSEFVNGAQSKSGSVAIRGPLEAGCILVVCSENSTGDSVCTPSFGLLTSLPQLSGVNCTPEWISIEWTLAPDLQRVAGYKVTLTPAPGAPLPITLENPYATKCTIPLQVPLPNVMWTVVVSAISNDGISASTLSAILNASTPALTGLNYDGQSLTFNWSAPPDPKRPIANYTLTAYSTDGGASATMSAGVSPATISLPVPLDATKAYFAVVSANAGSGIRSSTSPTPLMATLPALRQADYNSIRLEAKWQPLLYPTQPVTSYQMRAFSSGAPPITRDIANPYASSGTFDRPAFVEGQKYQFQVCALSKTATVCSLPQTLVTQVPILISALFDGASVRATWKPAPNPLTPVLAYRLTVFSANGGAVFVKEIPNPVASEGIVDLGNGFERTWPYQVVVTALSAGQATASTPPVELNLAQPMLTSAVYNGSQVTAAWIAPASGQAVTAYIIRVFSLNGRPAFDSTPILPPAASGSVAIPSGLDPDGQYVIQIVTQSGDGIRSATQPIELITELPILRSAEYDGKNALLHWTPVLSVNAPVSAYTLSSFPTSGAGPVTSVMYPNAMLQEESVPVKTSAEIKSSVQVCATAGPVQACSHAMTLVRDVPQVQSSAYDGAEVRATWSAVSGSSVYRLRVLQAGGVVAEQTVENLSGSIAAVLDATLKYSVRVRALVDQASGPWSPAAPLVVVTPATSSALTNPVTASMTVKWNEVTGATGYVVQMYLNGAVSGSPVSVPTNSYTPAALDPGAGLSIAVAVVSGNATGPFSTPVPLPTLQPVIRSVDYDGVVASIAWQPTAGATGYRISVIADGASQPAYQTTALASASSVSFNPALTDLSKDYNVVVQAEVSGSTGLPSPSAPLFEPGFFVSTKPLTQAAPYLNPAWGLQTSAASDIVVYLPELAATGTVKVPVDKTATFKLLQNTDAPTKSIYPYTLTIPANSPAWTFTTAPIRTQVYKDYDAFLKAAELAGVSPGGILVLAQVISRAMPQTFQETLYYAYGLEYEAGIADLRPGLILRCASPNFMNPGSGADKYMIGFAGAPVVDYEISTYTDSKGKTLAGFDAFIAQLVANGGMRVNPPDRTPTSKTEAGLADSADLFYDAFRTTFYRLFFPSPLISPTSIGSVQPAQNFAIAAAANYDALTKTVNYPTSTGNPVAYFRGRVVVKLCIRVVINGAEEIVPVGTTVRNILERFGWQAPSTKIALEGLTLRRALGPAVFDPLTRHATGQSFPVRLGWNTLPVYGGGRDALSLPLLHGDQITIRASKE